MPTVNRITGIFKTTIKMQTLPYKKSTMFSSQSIKELRTILPKYQKDHKSIIFKDSYFIIHNKILQLLEYFNLKLMINLAEFFF